MFPILLLLILLKNRLFILDRKLLVRAVNCTLLTGSVLYVLSLVIQIIVAYFSQADYEKYALINHMFGPYWLAWLMMVFPTTILPQFLWIKKFQNTIVSTGIILLIYILLVLFELKDIYGISWSGLFNSYDTLLNTFLTQITIYIAVLVIVYFILYKTSARRKA